MITATIDTTRAQDALGSLHDAMVGKGLDASNLIRDELKMLARTIVNFTPPLGPGGRAAGAKQAGEMAISRELENLISEAKPEFLSAVSQRWGIKDVQGWTEGRDKMPLALRFANIDADGSRLDELHHQYQNNRGKVPLLKGRPNVWASRIVTNEGNRAPFISRLQTRVGRWKASWALAASMAGSKFPTWISKHFGNLGNASIANLEGLRDPVKPSVTFGSRVAGNARQAQRVQQAVNFRAKVIARRVKLILGDYKDWRSIRNRANAIKHGQPEPAVE